VQHFGRMIVVGLAIKLRIADRKGTPPSTAFRDQREAKKTKCEVRNE